MSEQLGFSVSCYRGDVPLLRGCLSSIRAFAPDAPICLFTDGDFPISRVVKAFDVIWIPRSSVRSSVLRERSYGYGLTKMVALWEAPFERIIHLDADTVLWGDIRANLPSEPWDFVYNEPHELITNNILRRQYFDPDLVKPLLKDFQWRHRPFFNSGVFACRVGALRLDEYVKCLDVMESNHSAIFQDQGVLALMVFKALDAGEIVASQVHLQTVVPVVAVEELRERFVIDRGRPVLSGQPTVIHWAGPKPYVLAKHPFAAPMHHFRARGMAQCGLLPWVPSGLAMRLDELRCRSLPRLKQQLKSRLKAVLNRHG